jgi:methionine-S-sulfoxide reductase
MRLFLFAVAAADVAVFAGGCFWCIEAVFESVPGVTRVVSGYTGDHVEPTYKLVTSGKTEHVEAVHITFDKKVVSYAKLLDVFFDSIDPFQANGQGMDRGKQYRSVIFYYNAGQEGQAQHKIDEVQERHGKEVATELIPADAFWSVLDVGEEYHDKFYQKCLKGDCYHPGYFKHVVLPKVEKAQKLGHIPKQDTDWSEL